VLESINTIIKVTGLNLVDMIEETKHYLTITDHITMVKTGHIGARDEDGSLQLQHVDLLFRLYLPLYSLL
jgi:hypothetical protein